MANYLFSWLFLFLFFLSNFCCSEGPYIFLKNFKKNVPMLLQQISIDHIKNEEDSLAVVASILDKFSEKLPSFRDMVNHKDQPMSVHKLINCAFVGGFSGYGDKNSLENVEIRNMIYLVLNQIINSDNEQKADELFMYFSSGFLESQEIQYKILVDLYWQLRKISSLEILIYDVLDGLKKEWVRKTIHQLEKNSQALSPELEAAYLLVLEENNEFGLLLNDKEKIADATKKFQGTQYVRDTFCSFVNTSEFFFACFGAS